MIRQALDLQHRLTGESLFATIKRYLVFVFGGGIGWLIIVGMQALFIARWGEILSYWVGLLFADVFTFVYHRCITFKIKSDWKVRFVKFSVIVVLISVVNGALFSMASKYLDLASFDVAFVPGRVIASFLITLVLSIINFAINRIFIFRHH